MTREGNPYDELYALLDDLCDGLLSERGGARLDQLCATIRRRSGVPVVS